MKQIAALFLVIALMLALVPAAMADQWYDYCYCNVCGRATRCVFCLDDVYEDAFEDYHYHYHSDCAMCQSCGNYIYNFDESYGEYHSYVNGYCVCGHRSGRSDPYSDCSKKVFICSNAAKVRSEPGPNGSLYTTARYGDMFEYVGTVEYGYDGDPWLEVRYNGMTAYIPGGTRNSQFWLNRRACEIRYYKNTKSLRVTGDTHMVKSPDEWYGDNKTGAVDVRSGDRFTCYGEIEDELYPSRVWYLVKYSGAWFFVPSGKASVN